MKLRAVLITIGLAASVAVSNAAVTDLVISEVLEGNGGNLKYVEILNRGATSVDLAAEAVKLRRYANGGTTPFNINLTGSVAAGARYVIANNQSDLNTYMNSFAADQVNTNITHNGNDAWDLVYGAGNTVIDAFAFDRVIGSTPPDFAINVVAFRRLAALPNNGDWGMTTTPADGVNTDNGYWVVKTISATNANALSVGTPGVGGGANGAEVPVTVSGFSME